MPCGGRHRFTDLCESVKVGATFDYSREPQRSSGGSCVRKRKKRFVSANALLISSEARRLVRGDLLADRLYIRYFFGLYRPFEVE